VNLNLCESCLEKQRTIDRLKQEIQSLREKAHWLERKAEAGQVAGRAARHRPSGDVNLHGAPWTAVPGRSKRRKSSALGDRG
jgi:hypothetical protein